MTAAAQAVAAHKAITHAQAGVARHLGAQHRLHGRLPHCATGHHAGVVAQVIGRGANDAVALETVAHADRNQLGHLRVGLQRLHIGQRHIAGGRVDLKHARQNQLQRAAFGTHHHVNASQVARKGLLNLVVDQQHQRDGRQPQRQQQ